jgi:hypothetical protein
VPGRAWPFLVSQSTARDLFSVRMHITFETPLCFSANSKLDSAVRSILTSGPRHLPGRTWKTYVGACESSDSISPELSTATDRLEALSGTERIGHVIYVATMESMLGSTLLPGMLVQGCMHAWRVRESKAQLSYMNSNTKPFPLDRGKCQQWIHCTWYPINSIQRLQNSKQVIRQRRCHNMEQSIMYESLARINPRDYGDRAAYERDLPRTSCRIKTIRSFLMIRIPKGGAAVALPLLTSYVDCNDESIQYPPSVMATCL